MEVIDLAGQRFGRLIVLSRAGSTARKATWLCHCDCGQETTVIGQVLRRGECKSCGCLQRELIAARKTQHGATKRGARWPEWGIYRQMLNRCYREKNASFKNYGGRGIKVCDRWRTGAHGLSGFECFVADMGRRPHPLLTVERRNNDGNYEPGNCCWATRSQQALNRRKKSK